MRPNRVIHAFGIRSVLLMVPIAEPVGDARSRCVRECERHRLAALIVAVVEHRDLDRLRRLARGEAQRPALCGVVLARDRGPVRGRIVHGNRGMARAVEGGVGHERGGCVDLVLRLVVQLGQFASGACAVRGRAEAAAVEVDVPARAIEARVRAQAHAVGVDVAALHDVLEVEACRARARGVDRALDPSADADGDEHRSGCRHRLGERHAHGDSLALDVPLRRVARRRADRH